MNLEFALLLLVPWLLDLTGGRAVLASIFGALLWGAALTVSVARRRTRDLKFKNKMGVFLAFLSGSWLVYWVLCFLEPAPPIYFESRTVKFITLLHAGILAAGLGMILVLAVASFLWLSQDFVLRKSSWERRRFGFFQKLPPLESLARVAGGAIRIAFSSWGFGLLLAVLAALMHWKLGRETVISHSLDWLLDPRIFLTAALWLLLSIGDQLGRRLSIGSPWLYRSYLALSLIFLFTFNLFFPGTSRSLHEPINWFVP